ncbi:MAG: hypothetical protein GY913_21115 [Proteobacteria bacterium]|nr:hypothetical protein [Pseudomonadota bacterium]MCP4919409.1 hypothetical protein [Pseudomonadota bacterium]
MHTLFLAMACGAGGDPEVVLPTSSVESAAAESLAPDLPLGQMPSAELSRAEIEAGEHITVSGTVGEGCEGAARIDVIDGETRVPKTLTVLQLADDQVEFEVLVPTGTAVQVTAICDVERDGRISPTDGLSNLFDVDPADGDATGVDLVWLGVRGTSVDQPVDEFDPDLERPDGDGGSDLDAPAQPPPVPPGEAPPRDDPPGGEPPTP